MWKGGLRWAWLWAMGLSHVGFASYEHPRAVVQMRNEDNHGLVALSMINSTTASNIDLNASINVPGTAR